MNQGPGIPDRTDRPLKLRARDAEDLQAVAACLQDALVPLSDMAFLQREKRFVMVANRFRWERRPEAAPAAPPREPDGDARFEDAGPESPAPAYERVNCGVAFDRVARVRSRGVDLARRDQILNLLTLRAEPGAVTLVFSDGAEIRLEVGQIRCHMEDLGEPWPTGWRPSHPLDDVESGGAG